MAEEGKEIIQKDRLDFSAILFNLIDKILVNCNNPSEYSLLVSNLDDFLAGQSDHDEIYNNEVKKLDEQLYTQVEGLRPDMRPQDAQKMHRFTHNRNRRGFRALMKLIARSGFVPFKEIEAVLSLDEDAMMKDMKEAEELEAAEKAKLADIEKENIKENENVMFEVEEEKEEEK